jgi:hypothetical protein
MIALIVSIFIGWLLLKILLPRAPFYIDEPPAVQVVVHLHLIVPVKTVSQNRETPWAATGPFLLWTCLTKCPPQCELAGI